MNKFTPFFAFALPFALIACDNDPAPQEEVKEAEIPSVEVDKDFVENAGRWSTQEDALYDDRRIIIDIASNGRFSIDVRVPSKNGEAIVESSKGKALKQGNNIAGTVEKSPGVHETLRSYSTWTIDTEAMTLSNSEGVSIPISKG